MSNKSLLLPPFGLFKTLSTLLTNFAMGVMMLILREFVWEDRRLELAVDRSYLSSKPLIQLSQATSPPPLSSGYQLAFGKGGTGEEKEKKKEEKERKTKENEEKKLEEMEREKKVKEKEQEEKVKE